MNIIVDWTFYRNFCGNKDQKSIDKEINFWPLVPQKLSVEGSIRDEFYQKKVSSSIYVVGLNQYIAKLVLDTALWPRRKMTKNFNA